MRQAFPLLWSAMFGYVTVCAGLTLFYFPVMTSLDPSVWLHELRTLSRFGWELFGLLPCIALAGYACWTLLSRHAVLKTLLAMAIAVIAAIQHPLGDHRPIHVAVLEHWPLAVTFVIGPALVVWMLGAGRHDDVPVRPGARYRTDDWLKKIGYFRRRR